jgi:hypothetical protein
MTPGPAASDVSPEAFVALIGPLVGLVPVAGDNRDIERMRFHHGLCPPQVVLDGRKGDRVDLAVETAQGDGELHLLRRYRLAVFRRIDAKLRRHAFLEDRNLKPETVRAEHAPAMRAPFITGRRARLMARAALLPRLTQQHPRADERGADDDGAGSDKLPVHGETPSEAAG